MNATPELPELDERGRAAAHDVRTRAADRPVPAFDPDRPVTVPLAPATSARTLHRPFLAAAAAAVAVALVGVGVWVGTRGDDTSDIADQVVAGSIQPYLLGVVPEGMELGGVVDSDGSVGPDLSYGAEMGPMSTFGPAIDDPRVGLYVSSQRQFDATGSDDAGADTGIELVEELVVGDGIGYLYEASHMLGLLLEVPLTDDPEGPALQLFGRDDGSGALGAVMAKIAAATTVDGLEATVDEERLPIEGWRLLDTDPDGILMTSPMATLRGLPQTRSASAYYLDATMERTLGVTVLARPEASVHTQRLLMDSVETVTVRGHDAVVGRLAIGDDPSGVMEQWSVRWMERPGEVVTVAGLGVERSDVLAAAESIQPVAQARWSELVEATALGDLAGRFGLDPPGVELGRGRFADGTAWVLRYTPESTDPDGTHSEMLDLAVALPGGSSSSSGSSFSSVGQAIDSEGNVIDVPAEAFRTTTTLEKGGRAFTAGLVRDDVVRVELRAVDGRVVGQAEVVTAEGVTAWLAELTDETVTAVAVAADGQEFGTTQLPRYDGGDVTMGPSPTISEDVATTLPAPTPTN